MIYNYATVKSGMVTNIILWDGNEDSWPPPEEVTMVVVPESVRVDIGDQYDGEKFVSVGDPWLGS